VERGNPQSSNIYKVCEDIADHRALPPFPIINTLVLCSFDVLRMFVGFLTPISSFIKLPFASVNSTLAMKFCKLVACDFNDKV